MKDFHFSEPNPFGAEPPISPDAYAGDHSSSALSQTDIPPQIGVSLFRAQFKSEPLAYQFADHYYARMRELDLSDEQAESKAGVIYEFVQIGGRLLLAEPGLMGPQGEILMAMTVPLARQVLWLLSEGLFYIAMQCHYQNIDWELEKNLHETIAQELFDQARHLAIATDGLSDPIFIPSSERNESEKLGDQKIQMILQSAKTAMSYWLSVHQDTIETPLPERKEADEHLAQLYIEAQSLEAQRELSKEKESLAIGAVSQEWFVHWVRIWRYLNEKPNAYQPVTKIRQDNTPEMGSCIQFRPEHLAQDIATIFQERLYEGMMKYNLSEIEMETIAQYLYEYTVVGGESLKDSLSQDADKHAEVISLYLDEKEAPITMNRQMVRLAMLMYAETLYQALIKSYELSTHAAIREKLLKHLAYDFYISSLKQLRRFQVNWFQRIDTTLPASESTKANSDFMLLVLRHLMNQQEQAEKIYREGLNQMLMKNLGIS